jgi:hypothetical protein
MKPTDFMITDHAITRLKERFPLIAKQLQEITVPAFRKKFGYDLLANTKENRSFKNNSSFMSYLGEKYGFDKKYSFFVNEDIVFVGVTDGDRNVIVTIIDGRDAKIKHLGTRATGLRKRA